MNTSIQSSVHLAARDLESVAGGSPPGYFAVPGTSYAAPGPALLVRGHLERAGEPPALFPQGDPDHVDWVAQAGLHEIFPFNHDVLQSANEPLAASADPGAEPAADLEPYDHAWDSLDYEPPHEAPTFEAAPEPFPDYTQSELGVP